MDEAARASCIVIFVFVLIEIKKYSKSMVNVYKVRTVELTATVKLFYKLLGLRPDAPLVMSTQLCCIIPHYWWDDLAVVFLSPLPR